MARIDQEKEGGRGEEREDAITDNIRQKTTLNAGRRRNVGLARR
jgi:hypothetical protein